MINAHDIRLEMGTQIVFDGISFVFNQEQRVGLVGLNGSGKSTLLKVLAGSQPIHRGSVSVAKGKTLAYLPQDVVLQSGKSIIDETVSVFDTITQLIEEQKRLEVLLEQSTEDDTVLEAYA